MNKEWKKKFSRGTGWVLMSWTFYTIKFLPLNFVLFFGRVFGLLGYIFSFKHRRVALESLRIAFNNSMSERKIGHTARECFKFMGEASWEMFYFLRRPELIKERVEISGKETLDKALGKGRGVIALTAHFGDFPLMCLRLAEEGYTVNTMAVPMRDKRVGRFIQKLRDDSGIKTIFSYPRKRAVFDSLKALEKNEILVIQMDQNFGTGGVWVKFFGKLAATPVGPVVLGLRSESAVVPVFIVRKSGGRHIIFIEEKVPLEKKEDKNETVLVNAVKLTKIIEKWVRSYPKLWGWIHRRWKSRPSDRVKNLKFKIQKD